MGVVEGGDMISNNGIVHKIHDVLMPPDLILKSVGVDIFFDQYPEDISWELFNTCNGGKVVVAEGRGYGPENANKGVNVFNKWIKDGTFKFVIKDQFGDGLCCTYGAGSYKVYYGVDMIESSDFEMVGEESVDFGTEKSCPEPEETPESVAKYDSRVMSPQCGFPDPIYGDFGEVILGPLTEALTHCTTVGSAQSGPLSLELLQAKTRSGEPNGPNTAHGICQDGDSGVYKTDESIESVSVIASEDSGVLKHGGTAKVQAQVYSFLDGAEDRIDFFFYNKADTTKESGGEWVHISTASPVKGGLITVESEEFVLPTVELLTVRTVIRWSGEDADPTSCPRSTGSGEFSDVDDLVVNLADVNGCVDHPTWFDGNGNKCDWYESNDTPGCPTYGDSGKGWPLGTANENCCYCKL